MFALTVDHDIQSNTKARKIGYCVAKIKSHEKPQAREKMLSFMYFNSTVYRNLKTEQVRISFLTWS
jgi:hypothetical protein